MITTRFIIGGCLAALLTLHGSLAWGQSKFINYQGRLLLGGVPANGTYAFQFKLFSDSTNGISFSTNTVNNVTVSDGLFSAGLSCGQCGFRSDFNGDPRWLEIGVCPSGSDFYTRLSPRQQITTAPYAAFAENASNALTAATATSVPWSALTGVPAGFADGVDNNTIYTAGPGLSLSGTTFFINPVGITSSMLASNAVTSDKLADGAVTLDKVNIMGAAPGQAMLYNGTNVIWNNVWKMGGNTGSGIPGGGGIALGSLDATPVDFIANGIRALRLEAVARPGFNLLTPNLIAGSPSNSVSPGVQGAAILGGGHLSSEVPQGQINMVNADFGTVAGGVGNTAGAYSFAAGHGAQAHHSGSFVWADNSLSIPAPPLVTTGSNQFLVRATGGVRVLTGGAGMTIDSQPVLSGPVGSAQLADGAVTTPKLANGGVNSAKLAAGAVTLDKLNIVGAAAGQAMHYNGSSVVWSNVSWSTLAGIPAGFADGIDNNNTYMAGAALNLSGTTFSVASNGITSSMLASNSVTSDKLVFDAALLPRVSGGNLSIGSSGETYTYDHDLRWRGEPDVNHGVGWYGTGKLFAGQNIDGSVLYGWEGGALGKKSGGEGVVLRWTAGGRVGLGVEEPAMVLDVRDGSGPNAQGGNIHVGSTAAGGDPKLIHFGDLQGDGLGFVYLGEKGADDTMELRAARFFFNAGTVGIGVSNATHELEVRPNGTTLADSWNNRSSRRWKTNIQTIPRALDKVQHLRGVTYDRKDNGKHDLGLIAEEVGEVIPEIVTYEANGKDAQSVDYARLVAVLIEAVKEQQAVIDEMRSEQKRLAVLKAPDADHDTSALSQRLAALEKMIGSQANNR